MTNWEKALQLYKLEVIDDCDICSLPSSTKFNLRDDDGYLYFLSRDNLGVAGRRESSLNRFFNASPHTEYNIANYLNIVSGGDVVIESFNASNAHDSIDLYCISQDFRYKKSWCEIKNGGYKLFSMDDDYVNPRITLTLDDVKATWENKYDITVVDDKYINNCTPIKFICNQHPDSGVQSSSWANSLSAKYLCLTCSRIHMADSIIEQAKQKFEFNVADMKSEFINVLGEYTSGKCKIECECLICGRHFKLRADHILRGIGCGCSNRSIGEQRVAKILKERGIAYKEQYRFKNCVRFSKPLPFDFYLPQYKTAIEYDGIQHSQPVELFGGREEFEKVVERDAFKTQYCKDHNIRLIRIPHKDINDIESYLEDIA